MTFQVLVSPLLPVLSDKFRSLAHNEVDLVWGVNKAMNKLADTLSTIQKVIHDAEEKQVTDQAVASWLRELRALAYDAEDILEEWEMDASQLQFGTFWTSVLQVCPSSIFSCFCFEQISLRRRMAMRVNELEQKFVAIDAERSRFQLTGGVVERPPEHYQNRETSSFLRDPIVYGRDAEREYVVGLLLSNVDNPEVSVCPIVGMGGLGKTTLAQLCYNDPRVERHFAVRIWVCVSDDFDVKRLTKEIIVLVSGQECNIDQLDTLQRCLWKELAGKRFLLVLDDVWGDNQEQWSRLESPLRCGAPGSTIMVTTRLKRLAVIIGTCPPYFPRLLSEDECWLLFQQRAFGIQNEASPNLVEIGRAIVKKCGGVPLAVKVLGGLLRFKRDENDWLVVRDSNIWDLRESIQNYILPVLRLSYTDLVPELKQCFAFCSVYPKGHKMKEEELVRLWMANNLIQPKKGMQLEDIGNKILGELCWRSFLEEAKEDREIHYMMHDLMHDLACSINVNECCYMDDSSQITNIPSYTRHLFLSQQRSPLSNLQTLFQSGARLRTLVIKLDETFPDDLPLSCFISLRALSLGKGYVLGPKLIESIVHLKHLKYLSLSENIIVSLPQALCKLKNLQTLELVNCRDLEKLPDDMGDMSRLRHLDIKGCSGLSEMPIGLGKLTSLHTLSIFIVARENGRGIAELEKLEFLSGELAIKGLEHVNTPQDAKKANLGCKKNLTSLELTWSDSADMEGGIPEALIEDLLPHANVIKLSIHGYRGRILFARDDMAHEFLSLEYLELSHMPKLEEWFSGNSEQVIRFPNLKELKIRQCPRLKSLPTSSLSLVETLKLSACNPLLLGSLDNLPRLSILKSLQDLEIADIPDLESLPDGLRHVSSNLRELSIQKWSALISLPDWIETFTNLRSFYVIDCKNLKSLSNGLQHLTNLQYLRIYNCHPELHGRCSKESGEHWPMVAHIPHIDNDPGYTI